MAAKNKEPQNKEKNCRSRYDANRPCYRQDKTHYVYQEWVETGKNKGYYIDHVFSVGEHGITLELLDMLLETDNAEAQDSEDAERYEEHFAYGEGKESEGDDDFDYSPMDNISTSYVGGKGMHNLASPYKGSPELIGPEAVLFPEEEKPGKAETDFDEYVRPELSEDQLNLVYDRFGMDKTLQQIADESPVKSDGTHVTHQAVTNKLNRIFAKVKKHMPEE